jgi:hypothetical protein
MSIKYLAHFSEDVVEVRATDDPKEVVCPHSVAYSVIEWRLRKLAGRVLTAIDAAIPQGPQNKATKDIVRAHIMDEYTFFSDTCYDGQSWEDVMKKGVEIADGKPISHEEILGA